LLLYCMFVLLFFSPSSSYIVFVFFALVYWTLPPGKTPIAVNINNNNNNNNKERLSEWSRLRSDRLDSCCPSRSYPSYWLKYQVFEIYSWKTQRLSMGFIYA
jgi:hypothetical protein